MAKWTFDSELIAAIDYIPELQILIVYFKKGGVFEYSNIPPAMNQEFRDAPSPGKFYHQHIRGNPDYMGRKIEDVAE